MGGNMKANEKLMTELIETSKYEDIQLFEVVATYAKEHDIDPVELVKMFDKDFIYQIKASATINNQRLKNIEPKLRRRSLI